MCRCVCAGLFVWSAVFQVGSSLTLACWVTHQSSRFVKSHVLWVALISRITGQWISVPFHALQARISLKYSSSATDRVIFAAQIRSRTVRPVGLPLWRTVLSRRGQTRGGSCQTVQVACAVLPQISMAMGHHPTPMTSHCLASKINVCRIILMLLVDSGLVLSYRLVNKEKGVQVWKITSYYQSSAHNSLYIAWAKYWWSLSNLCF